MPMWGSEYTTVTTTPVDETTVSPTYRGAINGGLMQRSANAPSPVITILVDGIDDAIKKIETEGGSVVQARTEIPSMATFACVEDPEGDVMGLWESASA